MTLAFFCIVGAVALLVHLGAMLVHRIHCAIVRRRGFPAISRRQLVRKAVEVGVHPRWWEPSSSLRVRIVAEMVTKHRRKT